MESRVCELCGGDASVYCASDSAFLCFRCDSDVHGANFLVARHVRHSVCSSCKSLAGGRFSGAGIAARPAFCLSCSGERPRRRVEEEVEEKEEEEDSLSSESDCISSTGSAAADGPAKVRMGSKRKLMERLSSSSSLTEISGKDSARLPAAGEVSSSSTRIDGGICRTAGSSPAVSRIDARAEGILDIWRQRMGLSESSVVVWAARALGSSGGEITALPLRILLAASFWLGLRMCSGRRDATWQAQTIRKLEEVSGVPGKLIVAGAAKLAGRASHRRREGRSRRLEEGCGECSV